MDDIKKAYIYYADQGIEFVNDTRDYEETEDNTENKPLAIIFGVTGQDGSYLAELLLEKDYRVVGVARRSSTSNTERIDHIDSPNFKIVEGDVTDYESINGLIKEYQPKYIYNLAAQSHVGTSFKQPLATWEIDATGVLHILNAIKNNDTSIRFYQASTSEMFGKNYDVRYKDDPNAGPFRYNEDTDFSQLQEFYQDEDTEFSPQSPYAVAKLAAHHLIGLYRDAYDIFACSGILFNHCSPRRGENFVTRKITKWLAEFRRWKEITERQPENKECTYSFSLPEDMISVQRTNPDNKPYGDPASWCFGPKFPKLRLGNLDANRDWGCARDYVEGMVMMLEHDKPDDYILATGEARSVREFLDEAFNHIGIDDWTDYVVIDPEFFRPAEVEYLKGDASKAKEKLGWVPKTSFKELVKEMVDADYELATKHDLKIMAPAIHNQFVSYGDGITADDMEEFK